MAEKYEDAVAVNSRALEMRERVYGSNHRDVAISHQQKALSLIKVPLLPFLCIFQ